MKKNNYLFDQRISRDLETRHMARKILGVEEDASVEALKKAYRRASIKFHPDHNPNNKDAYRKFLLVKCAYRLLAENEPCEMLLDGIKFLPGVPEDNKYQLDNLWGHFLWWREKFFE